MTFRIFMAIMLMGAGVNDVNGMSLGHERSLMDEFRGILLDVRKLVGVPIPLDPRVGDLVFPDGLTAKGELRKAPAMEIICDSYDRVRESRAFMLSNIVRETSSVSDHYTALEELVGLANRGSITALSSLGGLFSPEAGSYQLSWPYKNSARARWLDSVVVSKERRLGGKTEEERNAALKSLRELLAVKPIVSDTSSDTTSDTARRRFGSGNSRDSWISLPPSPLCMEDRKTK